MWEESITMLPKIWQSNEFSWEGSSGRCRPAGCSRSRSRSRTRSCNLACTQTESFDVAADKGIGVLSSRRTPHPPGRARQALPRAGQARHAGWRIGQTSSGAAMSRRTAARRHRGEGAWRALAQDVLWAGQAVHPDRVNCLRGFCSNPWGRVPDHLKPDFGRCCAVRPDHQQHAREVGISLDSALARPAPRSGEMDPDTLRDPGIIIAGDPDNCIRGNPVVRDAVSIRCC